MKGRAFSLLLVAATLAAAGPAPAQKPPLLSDSDRAEEIRDRLDHLGIADLRVEVVGATVTLAGVAESFGVERDAARIAKSCAGVDDVVDALAIVDVPDDDVERSVNRALADDVHYTVYDFVDAEVRDGNVVLTGQATLPSDAEAIAANVGKVRGVRSVRNDVRILPYSPSDDRLREAVATAVYGVLAHLPVVKAPVRIVVEDGRVTLNGTLDDDRKIEAIGDAVKSVPGVVVVENLLTRELDTSPP